MANKREQHAVLEMGRSLGIYDLMHGTIDNETGLFVASEAGPLRYELERTASAFIAMLYAEAERRKEKAQQELPSEGKLKAEGPNLFAYIKGKWVQVGMKDDERLDALTARIEKLERLVSLVEWLNKERIQPLERAFDEHLQKERERENGKPLVSEDIINRQIDRINRFTNTMTGDDFYFCFDPKASPKGIPFSVALEYARNGRVIRRGESASTYSRHRIHGAEMNIGALDDEDMLANDWQVIPEP